MRRNNIELKKTNYGPTAFEIIKWYSNKLFGKEYLFEKTASGLYYDRETPHCYYSQSCFVFPESCYVLAFIEHGQVKFVGDRAIDLEDIQEYKDFLFLLRKGISKSLHWKTK